MQVRIPQNFPRGGKCATCRFNIPGGYVRNVGNGHMCERRLMDFPSATECRDYEREPGADDE